MPAFPRHLHGSHALQLLCQALVLLLVLQAGQAVLLREGGQRLASLGQRAVLDLQGLDVIRVQLGLQLYLLPEFLLCRLGALGQSVDGVLEAAVLLLQGSVVLLQLAGVLH